MLSKKLAVGVLASMAPDILRETLAHWPTENCSIYVHVDAKFDLQAFSFIDQYPHVCFVEERHRVMWGGFSLVDAEISIMKAALQTPFDYFILISDDTVPLRPVAGMIEAFDDPLSWETLNPTDNGDVWKRYRSFYCPDIAAGNPRDRTLEFDAGDRLHLLQMYMLMNTGKFPLEDLFWASNWKVLPYADVDFTVSSYLNSDWIRASFTYSINPDEHYIHTILGRRDGRLRMLKNLIWVDFNRDPKPFVFQTEEDLGEAMQRNFLFARKVHNPDLARTIAQRLQPLHS